MVKECFTIHIEDAVIYTYAEFWVLPSSKLAQNIAYYTKIIKKSYTQSWISSTEKNMCKQTTLFRHVCAF